MRGPGASGLQGQRSGWAMVCRPPEGCANRKCEKARRRNVPSTPSSWGHSELPLSASPLRGLLPFETRRTGPESCSITGATSVAEDKVDPTKGICEIIAEPKPVLFYLRKDKQLLECFIPGSASFCSF